MLPPLRGYNVNVEELDISEAWGMGQVRGPCWRQQRPCGGGSGTGRAFIIASLVLGPLLGQLSYLGGCPLDACTAVESFLQVAEIMTSTKVLSVQPDQPLTAAASKLDKITGLAVVDASNVVVGVVSIKDINHLRRQGVSLEEPVAKHMSTPPIVVKRDTVVADAAALMLARKIHRLPVVDDAGKLIG